MRPPTASDTAAAALFFSPGGPSSDAVSSRVFSGWPWVHTKGADDRSRIFFSSCRRLRSRRLEVPHNLHDAMQVLVIIFSSSDRHLPPLFGLPRGALWMSIRRWSRLAESSRGDFTTNSCGMSCCVVANSSIIKSLWMCLCLLPKICVGPIKNQKKTNKKKTQIKKITNRHSQQQRSTSTSSDGRGRPVFSPLGAAKSRCGAAGSGGTRA